ELRLDPRGEARVEVPLARPGAAASAWLLVLRERLLALRLDAPVAGLRLAVAEAAPAPPEQLALGDRPEALRALETVLSRLAARLGDGALFAAEPVDRHRPEAAYRAAAFTGKKGREPRKRRGPAATSSPSPRPSLPPPARGRGGETTGTLPLSPAGGEGQGEGSAPATTLARFRPTRLLREPLPLVALGEGGRLAAVRCRGRTHRLLALSGPERLSGEWWSEPFDRDYHRARLEELGDCWIYRDGADGRLWLHGFFD
ncbi:MAG TPA: DNA polymerase Y family protein, partial [Anaeromyxobacteraceae bacterium]